MCFPNEEGTLVCILAPKRHFSAFWLPRGHFSVHFSTVGPRGGATPPFAHHWYLRALTNLREEDDVTDTETEAWWTWDPGFPGLPCTRQIYSPESSGEADRIRSWLPRTCRQQTRSHFHHSVISISDTSDSSSFGSFFVPLLDRTTAEFWKGKGGERGDFLQD